MYHTQSGNSFPMIFSMANAHRGFDEGELYSPSASVDCTLSLGTPSTRNDQSSHHHEKKRSSCMSSFGWNILPSKHTPPSSSAKGHRAAAASNASSRGDPLLARRCANCDTTSTPLWRNGPRGPKSLCNACGIRYKKEERRATAAAATGNGSGAQMEAQYVMKAPCYASGYGGEYRFIDDEAGVDHSEMGGGVPFMSWRFNVTDRPGLVHDFTR
ncbi:GATA transcription factor 18-like [Salvia divinorum]|uniref:GATA transcription factor 18-like n=1 Tax=Salvia divinorum TaxID=28513 RepID=A0ABD1IFG9_SALDI